MKIDQLTWVRSMGKKTALSRFYLLRPFLIFKVSLCPTSPYFPVLPGWRYSLLRCSPSALLSSNCILLPENVGTSFYLLSTTGLKAPFKKMPCLFPSCALLSAWDTVNVQSDQNETMHANVHFVKYGVLPTRRIFFFFLQGCGDFLQLLFSFPGPGAERECGFHFPGLSCQSTEEVAPTGLLLPSPPRWLL